MKRLALLGVLFVAAVALPAHAQVRVGVDIGIHFPGPPAFVAVPGAPVYYAPRAPANVFLYGHQYWAFANEGWYVGPNWNGPWAVVQPAYVAAPILRVPVRYYVSAKRAGIAAAEGAARQDSPGRGAASADS